MHEWGEDEDVAGVEGVCCCRGKGEGDAGQGWGAAARWGMI